MHTKTNNTVREAIKYDWNRKPIYIGFDTPAGAFDKMDSEWEKIAFGVPRKDGEPVGFTQASPYAVARGSSMHSGVTVPFRALVNKTSFKNWAEEEGLGDGLSLEITGVMSKPGQKIIR